MEVFQTNNRVCLTFKKEVIDGVTRENLLELIDMINNHKVVPITFVMNPRDFTSIYTWGVGEFEQEHNKQIRETGQVGSIFGIKILIHKNCPIGKIYAESLSIVDLEHAYDENN